MLEKCVGWVGEWVGVGLWEFSLPAGRRLRLSNPTTTRLLVDVAHVASAGRVDHHRCQPTTHPCTQPLRITSHPTHTTDLFLDVAHVVAAGRVSAHVADETHQLVPPRPIQQLPSSRTASGGTSAGASCACRQVGGRWEQAG